MSGCMFACRPGAEDSVEHYANCSVLADLSARALCIRRQPSPQARLAAFLLLEAQNDAMNDDTLIHAALRTAAAYRVHDLVRHGRVRQGTGAREAWRQSLRELVRGSQRAAAALDRVWT